MANKKSGSNRFTGWLAHRKLGVNQLTKHMKELTSRLNDQLREKMSNPVVGCLLDRFLELEYLLHVMRNKLGENPNQVNSKDIKQYKDLISSQRKIVEALNKLTDSDLTDSDVSKDKGISVKEWLRNSNQPRGNIGN